jgi:hypothetical protein
MAVKAITRHCRRIRPSSCELAINPGRNRQMVADHRRASKRQSESRRRRPNLDEVANQENDVEIASIVSRMALPRGIEPLFQP